MGLSVRRCLGGGELLGEPAEMGGVTGPVLSSSLGVLSRDEPVAESLRPTGFEAGVVKGSP